MNRFWRWANEKHMLEELRAAGTRIKNYDDWTREMCSRIAIASPKTEKQGKSKRVIPLWPELQPLIETVIKKAAADQIRLLPFILPGYNPHTQFVRLIERAGLNPWPKV